MSQNRNRRHKKAAAERANFIKNLPQTLSTIKKLRSYVQFEFKQKKAIQSMSLGMSSGQESREGTESILSGWVGFAGYF